MMTDAMGTRGGPIQVVGFDADDTLWSNMPFFTEAEKRFCSLLAPFSDAETVSCENYRTECANMAIYGVGAKSYTLSLIETALRLSNGKADMAIVREILELGKSILNHPVTALDGVEDVLSTLRSEDRFTMVVATKGDLLEQERKLARSGLKDYFHHIEIMSDKTPDGYNALLNRLGIAPEAFVMVGNSVRSDILPVLELGAYAIHVPFHDTWLHEHAEPPLDNPRYFKIASIREILGLPVLRMTLRQQ